MSYSVCSHSTAKDKGEKKLFGFSFTPLMREDGTTLSDESHELYVYKVSEIILYNASSFACCTVMNLKLVDICDTITRDEE